MRDAAGRGITGYSHHLTAGNKSAKPLIAVASEKLAQILGRIASQEIRAEQALDGIRDLDGRAAIADRARKGLMIAYRPPDAEIIGVRQLIVHFDLLALDADIGNPVLAATVGTACDVQPQRLIELRQALLQFLDQPARKALGLRYGEFSELRASAGNGAAREARATRRQSYSL